MRRQRSGKRGVCEPGGEETDRQSRSAWPDSAQDGVVEVSPTSFLEGREAEEGRERGKKGGRREEGEGEGAGDRT
jgi:hypothetical protein